MAAFKDKTNVTKRNGKEIREKTTTQGSASKVEEDTDGKMQILMKTLNALTEQISEMAREREMEKKDYKRLKDENKKLREFLDTKVAQYECLLKEEQRAVQGMKAKNSELMKQLEKVSTSGKPTDEADTLKALKTQLKHEKAQRLATEEQGSKIQAEQHKTISNLESRIRYLSAGRRSPENRPRSVSPPKSAFFGKRFTSRPSLSHSPDPPVQRALFSGGNAPPESRPLQRRLSAESRDSNKEREGRDPPDVSPVPVIPKPEVSEESSTKPSLPSPLSPAQSISPMPKAASVPPRASLSERLQSGTTIDSVEELTSVLRELEDTVLNPKG